MQHDDSVTVNQTDIDGDTQLHRASRTNDVDTIKRLLQEPGININRQNGKGETALYIAAQYGHSNCLKLLLSMPGIAVNIPDAKGLTPLHIAAQKGKSECMGCLQPGTRIKTRHFFHFTFSDGFFSRKDNNSFNPENMKLS